MRRSTSVFALSVWLGLLAGSASYAQDDDFRMNIDEISCRDMLKMENGERDFTLIFMHGFMSGKQDAIKFDGPKLTEATEAILDACIDNPSEPLLSVFERVRGGG
jgi:HdeA/HdeB family